MLSLEGFTTHDNSILVMALQLFNIVLLAEGDKEWLIWGAEMVERTLE